jgi:glycosyltransferase involved in cell wall biosynthesis
VEPHDGAGVTAPRVSIGLPVFNGASFVKSAIEANLAQTFGDFELHISDNASTDDTPDICADFARADPRVRFVRQAVNCGVNRNHVNVFTMARGEFFRWANADDIPSAELLEHAVACLDGDAALVAYLPDTANIDEAGQFVRRLERNLDLRQSDPVARAEAVLTRNYQMVFTQGLMRRATLTAISPRWDYFGWDFVLLFALALRGQLCNVEGPLMYRRLHEGSAAHRTKKVAEVRKWVDPTVGSRILLPHWKWTGERLRAVLTDRRRLGERLRLLALVGRHARWSRTSLGRDLVMAVKLLLRRTDEYPF